MKRFMIFAGSKYYPSGGMEDFLSDHDTLEEALAVLDTHEDGDYKLDEAGLCRYSLGWAHIYDLQVNQIVKGLTSGGVSTVNHEIEYLARYGLDAFRKYLKREPSDYVQKRVANRELP